MAGAFSKHRFQVYNQNQHPYKHNLSEFAYASAGLPGVTNVEEAMDWLIATIYPLTQSAVALQADLPADGVITFSALGRLQGAPAAFSVGDLIYLTTAGTLPSCYAQNVTYKILDKDGTGLILGQQDGTAIVYVNDGVGVHTLHSIDNAFRVVFDDGDGKAAAYRWEQREGDLVPSWYKVYDMDWSQDSILAQFQNVTQDLYAYKMGKDDLDITGTPIAGVEGGQHIYGGATAGKNLTLHANAGDAPGVHSGAIRTDDPVHPTADNLFDLGTLLLRYKALYLAVSAQISTMSLSTGLITDSTGLISFDNENLVTTGNVTATDVVGTNRVLAEADLELKAGSIKSASGAISFDNENLTTTGTILAARYNLTNGGFVREIVANDLQFSSASGFIDFDAQTLRNILALTATTLNATTANLGDLTVTVKTLSSTGRIILAPNAIDKFVRVVGGLQVVEDSTFSASVTVNVDLDVLGNTDLTGTLGVTGDTTLVDLFVNGDISSANAFLNYLKYIVAPRIDVTTANATTVNATTFKGTNLTDPLNNTALISDIVKFPFTATTQDFVPHWDTATTRYIAKAITYPNHAGLLGLTADDHPQYPLLDGRTGGQVLAGAAAAAAGNLRLIGQAGAIGANKIIVDDKIVPGANATYTGVWQGYDLGSATENLRHIYTKGEHFGLRFENVAGLPAANVVNIGRIVYNTLDQKAYVDLGGTWKALGSGTGGGGAVNLITNGDAEDATGSIFIEYSNPASSRPTTGVGAGATVTSTLSSISPLTGMKSYELTKTASNMQGQGWSLPDTPLDLSYRAKVLKISVDYIIRFGTFVAGTKTTDSDIIWTCYDITNSKIVEPSNIKMFSSSNNVSDKFEATVQFDSNCTSFRLMAHVATTSTASYTVRVDNITVSPSVYVYGSPVTDPKTFTSTPFNFGNGTVVASISRSGAFALIEGTMIVGSTLPTGIFGFSLPAGLVADYSQVPKGALNTDAYQLVGTARGYGPVFNNEIGIVQRFGGSTTQFQFTSESSSDWSTSTPVTWVAGSVIEFEIKVQILGWSSSVQMSDSYDGRVISLHAYRTSNSSAIASSTDTLITFPVVAKDSVGAFNGTFDTYTILSAGDYLVSGVLSWATGASSTFTQAKIYVDGALYSIPSYTQCSASSFSSNPFSVLIPNLKAGQTIKIYGWVNAGSASVIQSDANKLTLLNISKIQGPQAIAANESVNCRYTNTAGTSIANSGDIVVPFVTRDFDNHGSWVTDTYASNSAQKVRLNATILFAAATYAAGNRILMSIYKNGSVFSYGCMNVVSAVITSEQGAFVNDTISLVSGDTLQVRVANNRTAGATNLSTSLGVNKLTIERVG